MILQSWLEMYGKYVVDLKPSGKGLRGLCPFHSDNDNPSFFVYGDGRFKCMSCDITGDFKAFLAKLDKSDEYVLLQQQERVFNCDSWHKQLFHPNNAGILTYLMNKRYWSREVIDKRLIGFDSIEGRITIPVTDEQGMIVNIRKYLPNTQFKITGIAGENKPVLYPAEIALQNDKVYVFAGDGDRAAAESLGLPAMCVSGSESAIPHNLHILSNKEVVICYDIDRAGKKGRIKLALRLLKIAVQPSFVNIPLSEPKDADFTDYISSGAGQQDFLALPEIKFERTSRYAPGELQDISQPYNIDESMEFDAQIMGVCPTPYFPPKQIRYSCYHVGNTKDCAMCRLTKTGGDITIEPEPGDWLISFIDVADNRLRSEFASLHGIPSKCKNWTYTVKEKQAIYTALALPPLCSATMMDPQVIFSLQRLANNQSYILKGIVGVNPKNQKATFIVEDTQLTNGYDTGTACQPFSEKKNIKNIINSLETITGIYGRQDMLFLMDLMIHLPLYFNFKGRIHRGFTDCLIVGDTEQGKSKVAEKILNFYGLGSFITGENCSFAGLVGGVTQGALGHNVIKWGVYPMHDRGLLILDEYSSMSLDDIAKLSGLRSSGVAEVRKISYGKTAARVRAIVLSNARKGAVLTHNSGIDIVRQLIGRPEDISRFTVIMVIAGGEVSAEYIYSKRVEPIQLLDPKECHAHIKWVWSLGPDEVMIPPDTEDYIVKKSLRLFKLYESDFPLLSETTVPIKIARLCTAFAARIGNIVQGKVFITCPMVDYIIQFLDRIYSSPAFGYRQYARMYRIRYMVTDKQREMYHDTINDQRLDILHVSQVMVGLTAITSMVLEGVLGVPRETAVQLINRFYVAGMLEIKTNGKYYKTVSFTKLLREVVKYD